MIKLVSSVLALAAIAAAQSTANIPNPAVFPGGGTSGNIWRAGTNRVQCLYDSSNWEGQGIGQPIVISQLEWRNGAAVAAAITYPSVDIHIQPAAVNYSTPSTTFAANRSAPLGTPAYSGPVTVQPSATTGAYVINIPLTTPFTYSPDLGVDLLVEIVINAAPAPLTGTTIDTGFSNPAHLCNSVRSVGSTTALTGTASAFCPTLRTTYSNAPGAALKSVNGTGCYRFASSFYEQFAGSTVDLANSTVAMSPSNGGWLALTTPGSTIVPPTGAGLALGDDVVSTAITLPFAFDFPGGSTSSIVVDSNGSVVLSGTAASSIAGNAATLLGLPSVRLAAAAMDLLPDGVTNVANVFANVDPNNPNAYLITWVNVPNFGSVAVPPPVCNFQIALIDAGNADLVEFRYGTMANDGSSNTGTMVTGFSRGAGAVVPAAGVDLTAGPVLTQADQRELTLASSRPVTGTNWAMSVSNIPVGGVLGVEVIGISDPGLNDLFFLGLPGCGLRASLDSLNAFFPTGATHSYSLPIPNDPTLTGFALFSQTAMFVLPAPNAFGAITSNGVGGVVGTL
jgi:hypothetical protein